MYNEICPQLPKNTTYQDPGYDLTFTLYEPRSFSHTNFEECLEVLGFSVAVSDEAVEVIVVIGESLESLNTLKICSSLESHQLTLFFKSFCEIAVFILVLLAIAVFIPV
ncbi:hypothetical protein KSP39_PZI022683 [Platanthera zijinensis]|uniref:Uncharacterized protein n=1 Tax=Platanthera zijinensis TaxID=2320716 RepID=A0AAP0FUW5_9ASPA